MLVSDIERTIDTGKTMHIMTYLKHIKITPKTLNKWRESGTPLFKDDKDGLGFYIARGRNYDFVLEQSVSIKFI